MNIFKNTYRLKAKCSTDELLNHIESHKFSTVNPDGTFKIAGINFVNVHFARANAMFGTAKKENNETIIDFEIKVWGGGIFGLILNNTIILGLLIFSIIYAIINHEIGGLILFSIIYGFGWYGYIRSFRKQTLENLNWFISTFSVELIRTINPYADK